jgi:16S rRNA (cytidine1402-2'-O)-methyltransferase
MKPPSLFLVPNVIAEEALQTISPQALSVLKDLRFFLAEDLRTARRFLSSLRLFSSIEALNFQKLNKDTDYAALDELMRPLLKGESIGILSESGCPGVADPGAMAVRWAHEHQIRVVPLVGPSSLLLALMASGLNGQQFAFHGYLPIETQEAARRIRELERESALKNQTQIFIETPYRNQAVFQHLVKNLSASTRLCVALDLTGASEDIKTQTIERWRKHEAGWPKLPAVFLFLADA